MPYEKRLIEMTLELSYPECQMIFDASGADDLSVRDWIVKAALGRLHGPRTSAVADAEAAETICLAVDPTHGSAVEGIPRV